MVWVGLLILSLVVGAAVLFISGRVEDIAARLDYLSDVVDYLCTSLGRPDTSETLEDLESVLAYCEDVPEDAGVGEVSIDGSVEDVQCEGDR